MEPLISYVVPTHNRVEWAGECLQGLLQQSVKDIEVIVVNDASKDGTDELLNWFIDKDERVRVITNAENLGAGQSRNIGNEMARAPIIGVCDDDDCYVVERSELILKWFKENPESEMVNFPYVRVGFFNELKESFAGCTFDEQAFKERGDISYFSHPTAAYKLASIKAIGGYKPETEKETDDYQLVKDWIAAGKKIDFAGDDAVCLHRVLPTSIMAKKRGWRPEWAI